MSRAYTYPRSHRLQHEKQFDAVYAAKVRESRGPLTVYAIPNDLGHPRLGISVSRKVGIAPRRNRIKRFVREAFRLLQYDLPRGYDFIVVVRPHEPLMLSEYQKLMSGLLIKLHATWQKRTVPAEAGLGPAPVPATTSLDIEDPTQLLAYLRATSRISSDESAKITVLTGGVSNRTVLVERPNGQRWVIKQALAKLRTKVDWYSDPQRIAREALGMRHLATLAPAGTITPLVFEDIDNHLLAMEAVPLPHENWKDALMKGRIDFDHVEQFGALLGTIHRRSAESAEPLSEVFEDRSFFESLRLEPYYRFAAVQVPGAARFLQSLIDETRGHRECLVHGDYSPKNILIHNGGLVLLDHEVIHWGDPSFDVGFALAHLLSKAHHLRGHRQGFAQAAWRFCEFYIAALEQGRWSPGLEVRCVRQALGCLLARVAGRSTLEYLTDAQRTRQCDAVVSMMTSASPPASIQTMMQRFFEQLERHDRAGD